MHIVRRLRPAVTKVISLAMVSLVAATMVLSTALLPGAKLVLAATQVVSIQRVSVPSVESDNASVYPSISADGRYVAFESAATNLVPSDNNGVKDIFVHDRQIGETTRVSVASDGTQGDGASFDASISADGRYVAFWSDASNLVASDNNAVYDVFVHDRYTRETTRVSLASNGDEANDGSFLPSISADGCYVAFTSYASNLVTGDTNDLLDIFVHDRQTGETTRVNMAWDGGEADNGSNLASISADGRYVAFESDASNLVAGSSNPYADIFVHDRQTEETTRVSVSDNGTEADDYSYGSTISADGRYVAFFSNATNLVEDDDNGVGDIFVHDRQTGETTKVSVASSGAEGNDNSGIPSISADGRYVAFESGSSNLVEGDGNGYFDIFVHDRQTEETTRVSVASDNAESNGESSSAVISADGRYVTFVSNASSLATGDTNDLDDILVRDRQTDETTRVSFGRDGTPGNSSCWDVSISADGRYVSFESDASNLVAGDNNSASDVFVHDRQTGETTRVSASSGGIEGNDGSYDASISADGRYVAFYSEATNLVADDSNGYQDIFVHDRQTRETVRVSVASDGTQADGPSYDQPSISADGQYVAFHSYAGNLVSGDSNGCWDVFVHDRDTGETTRVSLASGGTQGNYDSEFPSISADGQYVAFVSLATNLVLDDTNDCRDAFVHDWDTGQTTRVSVTSRGAQVNGSSFEPSISTDGQYVNFGSEASDLVASDTNGYSDVFVHDRQTGETTRVSVASDGAEGNAQSFYTSISGDGRHVAFVSGASNLVTGDVGVYWDVFVVSWENPALAYTPTSLDFGARYQNSTASQALHIGNSNSGTLSYSLSEGSPWCSVTPATGDSSGEQDNVTIAIDTSELSPGNYSCVILIGSDGGVGVVPVHLSVQATPTIAVTPTSGDFGSVSLGSSSARTFTVSNRGTADLVMGTVAAANLVTAPFIIVSDGCSRQTIPPGGSRTLTVRFSPTAKGTFSDSFDVPSNDPNAPSVTVSLTGSGPNRVPTAPVVDITPDNPTTADDLVCSITTESTDADGDTITYTYQWYKDNVLQSSLTTNAVAAVETTKGQVWRCVVAPNDGTANGSPAEDEVIIQNSAPTAPVVAITPDSPGSGADLVCSITTQSTDADGDAITYIYQWYKDGVLQSLLTTNTVPAAETAKGQVWECVVSPSDGAASSSTAEAQVTVTGSAGGFPVGAIAGIAIGVLVVAGAASFFWFIHSKKAPPVS